MGRTPAYIFVVRHGNRLDAADKKWHLSSPTPYDPPLTYGGWLQARAVGNQISSILEQAKDDYETSSKCTKRRRRFKVVIHSSPFLRCAQTSIGISSGLAQTPHKSPYRPNDIFVSATGPPKHFRSTILRLDSFLGEWLSPEYFEQITPPPGAALMLGSAKAELLRREDYSALTSAPAPAHMPHRSSNASLWNGSPAASPSLGPMRSVSAAEGSSGSAMTAALTGQLASQLEKKGYTVPKPNYAISSSGKIPDGFVAHARDECVVVDYQWDSMRAPLDFGDGGQLGEEWTDMHKRFRRGLKKMVDWYATTDAPDEMVTQAAGSSQNNTHDGLSVSEDEDVETVVILVSHGAGCNALIGAITHQPVLMDVGIASITMAVRKQGADYDSLLAASANEAANVEPHVSPHQMYDIRMSASTDHLRSTTSTPVSSRSTSADGFPAAIRGRNPSISSADGPGPLIGSFVYSDPIIPMGSRSASASATVGSSIRRTSGSQRPLNRGPNLATATGESAPRSNSPNTSTPSFGLWTPGPSSLRLMDDGSDETSDKEDFDGVLPNFGRFKDIKENKKEETQASTAMSTSNSSTQSSFSSRFELNSTNSLSISLPPAAISSLGSFSFPSSGEATPKATPRGPILSAPIRIKTDILNDFDKPAEELHIGQLGDGLGGLWGLPRPPGEAERFRDMSLSKRRWTTTERA
ncbi:phosphoglycerate mutase family protein [Fusarium austroafricanum]|uniref:Phosphoglycerate mutase family protein n=1 Tax=Fusarium austroafricanum TaxID=2364996 RepID=A0A8H4K9T5_9HYPO|nr:phosphoglycerate mutase family protein [Fusarium austroafricanum]